VELLLYDEMVSALRHMYPINFDALDFVTQRVRKSFRLKYPSVIHERVNLQFVYGPDRSMKPFVEVLSLCHLKSGCEIISYSVQPL